MGNENFDRKNRKCYKNCIFWIEKAKKQIDQVFFSRYDDVFSSYDDVFLDTMMFCLIRLCFFHSFCMNLNDPIEN